jgi:hypothetical protein
MCTKGALEGARRKEARTKEACKGAKTAERMQHGVNCGGGAVGARGAGSPLLKSSRLSSVAGLAMPPWAVSHVRKAEALPSLP